TGRSWLGSIWVFKDPLKAPNEEFCTVGVQTEAGVVDTCWVSDRGILVASDSGAVELWEVSESEALMMNKFCKYEHDDIVTKVSVLSGKTHAVSGSLDCRFVPLASLPAFKLILLFQDRRVLLWDRRNSKPAFRIGKYYLALLSYFQCFIANDFRTEDGIVGIKNLQNETDSIQTSKVHTRAVSGLEFSSHSTPLLASVSEDCTVAVVDMDLSKVFQDQSHKDFVRSVSWSPLNSAVISTAGWDHQVLHHTISKETALNAAED
uniref:Methylosome protein WDR77 n=1 Tax=Callorhinchus milii TaxID=7868 RepID=A0A4W3GM97_CALMI